MHWCQGSSPDTIAQRDGDGCHSVWGAPLDTPRQAFQELAIKKVGENTHSNKRQCVVERRWNIKVEERRVPLIGVNKKATEELVHSQGQKGNMSSGLGFRARRQRAAKT